MHLKKVIFPYIDRSQVEKESHEESMLENEEIDTKEIDMRYLESEESAAQNRNQQGQELKILTPNQMLTRLPISAGNNSEKLKKEIRQLLYFLYRSKKFTKNIHKSLVNFI